MSTMRGHRNTEEGTKKIAEELVRLNGQAMSGDRLDLDFSVVFA